MKQGFLSELFLYRHRYLIGYLLIALLTLGLLVYRIGTIPPGYTAAEQASAVASYGLEFKPDISIVDLPYHILQKASLMTFGLTELGVRLPSIIIASLTSLGIFLLLRRWFADNIAIMGSIIAVISNTFLVHGRSGTAAIMVSLWAVWILLFATLISQNAKFKSLYKLLLIGTVGLSLYTPYMVYLLIATGLATLVHPHLRYTLRHADKVTLLIATFLCGLVVAPLGWYLYQHPAVWHDLVGIPATLPSPLEYAHQLGAVLMSIGGFFRLQSDNILLPSLSIPVLVLCLIGIGQAVRNYYSNRSHLLLIWLAILLPISAFDPSRQWALFIPLTIFSIIGLNTLIRMWYGLFPRNPYARLFGLLPIAALLVTIVQFNYTRYFIGLNHNPNASSHYNSDARLLHRTIGTLDLHNKPVMVVVPQKDTAFYGIEKETTRQLTVATTPTASFTGAILIAETMYSQLTDAEKATLGTMTRLVVNDNSKDSLRFRVFTR